MLRKRKSITSDLGLGIYKNKQKMSVSPYLLIQRFRAVTSLSLPGRYKFRGRCVSEINFHSGSLEEGLSI